MTLLRVIFLFLFAVGFFFLPWGFSFSPRVFFFLPWGFSFCREVFLFAVRFFFLPWVFSFLPWGFSFCREADCFALTVVGHRNHGNFTLLAVPGLYLYNKDYPVQLTGVPNNHFIAVIISKSALFRNLFYYFFRPRSKHRMLSAENGIKEQNHQNVRDKWTYNLW